MTSQTRITHQVVAKEPVVFLPLSQWHEIEDLLAELKSPLLRQSIMRGRAAYRAKKTIPYDQ